MMAAKPSTSHQVCFVKAIVAKEVAEKASVVNRCVSELV